MKKSITLLFFTLALVASVTAKTVNITLLQANDVYEMTPVNGGKYGGLARVQTVINQLKQTNPNTFSVFAGDMFSPSAIGTAKINGKRLAGQQMVAVLNAMKWDYMTLGNHEFDNGYKPLLARLKEAEFTIFTNNVLDSKTGKPLSNTQQSVVFEVEGVRIGMVGVVLQSLSKDFVSISDPLVAAQQAVAQLREKQQVDIVILVSHQQKAQDIVFASKLDVDLILGGHEHENFLVYRGPNFTPIAKADANARSVYIHDLRFDTATKKLVIASRLKLITDEIADDPQIKTVIENWTNKAYAAFRADGFEPSRKVTKITEALGGMEAKVRSGSTNLTELVAKSAAQAFSGIELSILNAGSIRIDDVIPAGDVSEYDVIRILPFGGDYSKVSMPGRLIKQTIAAGNNNIGSGGFLHYANLTQQDGVWKINGAAIDDAQVYIVAIASFLIERGDSGLEFLVKNSVIKTLDKTKVDARVALINTLKKVNIHHN
jgi:5'-nucleotidase/UDP-sugar diphosphatase